MSGLQPTYVLPQIDRWHQMLVEHYFAQEFSTDVWPPRKIVEFVQLNLVKQDEESDHVGLRTVQKDINTIYGGKVNTDLQSLLKNIADGSRILFEGRPGSGKTTLMVRISCEWGRGKLLESKLVIFVQLRQLPRGRDLDLNDILQVACHSFSPVDIQCFSLYIEKKSGENLVFIFDGFDEYAPGSSDDNYVSKLILKKVLPQSIVIVSARPAATQRFRQDATVWVEVVGFMKEQVLQYINSYFRKSKEKSFSLIKHLQDHHSVMNMCYLPLHCAMLVHIYKVDGTLPKTESEFYRDFALSHLFRGIHKQNLPTKPKLSFEVLLDKEKKVLHEICKLAFNATVDSRQVFEESDVHDICLTDNFGSDSYSFGLLVIDRYFAKFRDYETSYTFLHLTLQEYLAAIFIARLSEPEQINKVTTYCSQENLAVTWRFLLGILDYSKVCTMDLFNVILCGTRSNHLLHVQCAHESQHFDACTDVLRFHNQSLMFSSISNPSDIFSIAYVLKNAQFDTIDLTFHRCDFTRDDAIAILEGLGDRQCFLTTK